MTPVGEGRPKTLVERLLAPIADVRQGEAASVLLITLLMFLLLGAYYMLKTAREVFILNEGGAEVKSYSSAGQAVLLLFLVPAYAAFASRVNRVRLVQWVTLFFALNLVGFVAAVRAGFHVGIVYFLWVGIFNLMAIAQFWAFATDLYTKEQGRRLFPLIGVGSSLGAWVGAVRAGSVVTSGGPTRLLLAAAAVLVVVAFLAQLAARVAARHETSEQTAVAEQPLGHAGAFELIRKDRYLMLIAALTVLLNVVNTSGEYLFGRYVVEHCCAGTPGSWRWQNPLVAASARGELQPTTAQRLVGRRAWRSGPAYRAVRESHGVDQVASLPLGGSPEGVAAVVVARPGNDFTDAQVSILRRAQPVVVGLDRMLHRVASQPSTAPEPPADRPVLTNRQSEVLVLLARGLTAAAMARAMGCSERTVHRHLSGIYSELGVHDRLLAVQRATEWQLLPP